MQDFQSMLLHCGLVDLGYVGNMFTRENGQEVDAYVEERLDRAYDTVEWCELFLHSKLSHLIASYSDHVPIILTTQVESNHNQPRRTPKQFKEKWVTYLACEDVINHAQIEVRTIGSLMFVPFEKNKAMLYGSNGMEQREFKNQTKREASDFTGGVQQQQGRKLA